jgi:methylenetetrahydrofolate dehydrogenase (NADP+)/methenyltetrahydrofolate cyclohydrolase
VQLPLPAHISEEKVLLAISPEKDVDGFHPLNMGKLWAGNPLMVPSTPAGIMAMLHEYNVPLDEKHAVVIGRSNIVGKPMAQMLMDANATVTIAHSHTKNLAELTRTADILIVAIGRAKFVRRDFVKPGAVVIDVGMDRDENGKLVGDVDFDDVKEVASLITPVPGGVGPMTITMLMAQTVQAAERN